MFLLHHRNKEGRWVAQMCAEKKTSREGTRKWVLREAAKWTQVVQSGKQESDGRSVALYSYLKGDCRKDVSFSFLRRRWQDLRIKLQGRLIVGIGKNLFREASQVLEGAAQKGGGVSSHPHRQMCGWGTEQYHHVADGSWQVWLTVGLDNTDELFQPRWLYVDGICTISMAWCWHQLYRMHLLVASLCKQPNWSVTCLLPPLRNYFRHTATEYKIFK